MLLRGVYPNNEGGARQTHMPYTQTTKGGPPRNKTTCRKTIQESQLPNLFSESWKGSSGTRQRHIIKHVTFVLGMALTSVHRRDIMLVMPVCPTISWTYGYQYPEKKQRAGASYGQARGLTEQQTVILGDRMQGELFMHSSSPVAKGRPPHSFGRRTSL